MTTSRLLWGMTWRGAGWGVFFSFVFIVLSSTLVQIWNSPVLNESRESLFDNIAPAPSLVIIAIAGGLFWVGIIGAPVTLSLGIIGGFALGIYTRVFHFPISRFQTNLFSTKRGGAIFGFLWEYCWLVPLFLIPFRGPLTPLSIFTTLIAFLTPSIITGIAAAFVSGQLTRWYLRESAKGIAQNAASN